MDLLFIPSWRAIAVRGSIALLFGLGACLWPNVTLAEFVLLFGVYALLDGIVAIVIGSRLRATDRGWLLPLEGLLGIALGLLALARGDAGTPLITILVGVWALVTGALELLAAHRLRQDIPGEAFLAFGGGTALAMGMLILLFPAAGSLLLVVLFGSYALIFGASLLMVAMQLRDRENATGSGPRVSASR
jgi:uncharacterized membrane protein HdeD (DUF308 family)